MKKDMDQMNVNWNEDMERIQGMQRLLTALFSEVTDVAEHQKDLDKMYTEIKDAEEVRAAIKDMEGSKGTGAGAATGAGEAGA